jgi:hypothetical protein
VIPKVHGPWVYLSRAYSAGDGLVYDLDFDEVLTLWRVEYEEYEPLLTGFDHPHPNLAHITRVAIEGDQRMLASPVAGVRLNDLLELHRRQERRLPVPIALRIALDLAEGYLALGRPTLRTGRPPYACVGWDGATRVCVGPGPNPNARSNFTPVPRMAFADLSPEAIRGLERGMPHWAWAVGAVLFHMLTGGPLDGEGSEFERLQRVAREPLPRMVGRDLDLHPDLLALVDAILQRPEDARPTLDAIAEELTAFVPARAGEVENLLAHLYADQRAHILETIEQLRAAPPEPNDQLVVAPARFQHID